MSGYILEVELIDIEPTFGTSWGRLGKEFLRQALLSSMGWVELSCGWRGVSDDGWGEHWTTIFISAFEVQCLCNNFYTVERVNSFIRLSSFTRSRSSRSFIPIPITSSQAQILPSKETARVNVFHTFGRLITNQVHGVQTGGSSKSKNVQLLTQCVLHSVAKKYYAIFVA